MKATGIVRRVDDLGRIVIPKEIRRTELRVCYLQGSLDGWGCTRDSLLGNLCTSLIEQGDDRLARLTDFSFQQGVHFHSNANRLCLMIAAVFACVALSELWELSSLLTCMMLGAFLANLRKDSIKILNLSEDWTPGLFMLFFVLSA